jgi:DNA-binding SARP family transcriptional activator
LLEFRILGPIAAIAAITRSRRLARSASAPGILLLNVNRVVSTDQLIDLPWGEQPPTSGATALQVRVSQLRKALGEAGSVIVTRPPGYPLRLDGGQLEANTAQVAAGQRLAASHPRHDTVN